MGGAVVLPREAAGLWAAEPDRRLDEAADVQEVLLAILARHGIGADELAAATIDKRATRGGFAQRWWWQAD